MDIFVFFGTLEKLLKNNFLTHKGQEKCLPIGYIRYIYEFQSGGKEGKEILFNKIEPWELR